MKNSYPPTRMEKEVEVITYAKEEERMYNT